MATNQFDFIKGRYILESMVVAHEIIHDPSIILKLDYMKKHMTEWTGASLRKFSQKNGQPGLKRLCLCENEWHK